MKSVFKKLGFFVAGLALWASLLAPLHFHKDSDVHGMTSDCSVCHIQGQVRHVALNAPASCVETFQSVLILSVESKKSIFIRNQSFVSSRAPPLA